MRDAKSDIQVSEPTVSPGDRVEVPEYLTQRERAQRGDRLIQLVAVILALAAIVAAGSLLGPLNAIRRDRQLVIDPETVGTLPPDISLMTQTGTLRALAIVVGFVRAEQLKEKGRFFELMQLSTWLCRLAPRFASVWGFAAWNQAYNISVCEYTAEGRWLWVLNGIKLLRDEGLVYNPKSIGLYKELGFIFWHKVGDISDDHHWDYKKELAVQVERVLGAKPVALTEDEELDHFRPVVEAPQDVEGLIARDARVADFVNRLRAVGLIPGASLLEFVARYQRPEAGITGLRKQVGDESQGSIEQRLEVLNDESTADARDRLLAALRARELRTQFKMDPKWMMTLMEKYGPIDWRTPFAHALYWSSYGDNETKGQLNLDAADSMNTARFIFFALNNMFQRGRYIVEPDWDKPNESFLNTLPDPRFIDHLHEAYLEIGEEQDGDDPEFRPGTSGPRYWVGHVNFLTNAIRHLYFEGDAKSLAKAKRYFRYLREYDVDLITGKTKPQYMQSVGRFVWSTLDDAFDSSRGATLIIGTFVNRSLKEISLGNVEGSQAFMERAHEAYEEYMKDPRTDPIDRRQFEPLSRIYRDQVGVFMRSPGNSTYQKIRVWSSIDEKVRQDVYDDLLPLFNRLCDTHDPPLDVDKAFRAPPGMDEGRQREPEIRDRKRDASEGVKDFSP